MSLARYINDLLHRYDCVIVPNFGGFVTNKIGARVNKETNVIYPPKKQVTFNTYLQHNDGLLANHIASTERISFEKSLEKITEEVATWKKQLEQGKLALQGVGVLTINEESKLFFEPDVSNNFLPESFGLAKTEASVITRKEVVDNSVIQENNRVIPLIIKRAAVAAIIVSLTYTGWNYVQSNNHQKEFINQQEKAIQSATFVINTPLPILDLKVSKEKTKNFHIVAGAFEEQSNAQKKLNELKNKGFEASIIGENSFGLTHVAYGSYGTKELARKALKNIKRNHSEEAWLLEK
ncbi:MAG TPA: hypothetical protein DDY16_08730 [Tenacibaculum sp.]|nr:hypothetical protein [Tenacibaculum sp.]